MKKSYFLLFFALFLFSGLLQAQEIKIRKNIVLIDAQPALLIQKNLNGTTFADLKRNPLFSVSYHLETKFSPAHTKVIFLHEKKVVSNSSVLFTRKMLIRSLIESQALIDGRLQDHGLELFILKFDEPLPTTQRIVIEES